MKTKMNSAFVSRPVSPSVHAYFNNTTTTTTYRIIEEETETVRCPYAVFPPTARIYNDHLYMYSAYRQNRHLLTKLYGIVLPILNRYLIFANTLWYCYIMFIIIVIIMITKLSHWATGIVDVIYSETTQRKYEIP